MMNRKTVVENFYQAFSEMDAERMVTLYHPSVTFKDPAFGHLHGEQVKNMWRMLIDSQQGKDFVVRYGPIEETDSGEVHAQWEAQYTFSKTGRRIHNRIKATFTFEDGYIIRHIDQFPLMRWAAQALGWKGRLLGWTPLFKKGLQKQTGRLLANYTQQHFS